MGKKSPRGRRAGTSSTKDAVARAASACFAASGYRGATIRAIASEAGVDPSLVYHFFGSKRALFSHATGDARPPDRILAGRSRRSGSSEVGEALVETFLTAWDAPDAARSISALLRAAGSDPASESTLHDAVMRSLGASPGAEGGIDFAGTTMPKLRAALAFAQLLGLAWMRYVDRNDTIAAATPQLLARTFGPSLTTTIEGTPAARRGPNADPR